MIPFAILFSSCVVSDYASVVAVRVDGAEWVIVRKIKKIDVHVAVPMLDGGVYKL